MKSSITYKFYLLALAVFALTWGCIKEDIGGAEEDDDEVEVTFTFHTPADDFIATRANGAAESVLSLVTNGNVLVYKVENNEEILAYHRYPFDFRHDASTNTGTFRVRLKKSVSPDEKFTFDFLFNISINTVSDNVLETELAKKTDQKFSYGSTREHIQKNLYVSGSGTSHALYKMTPTVGVPMWAGIYEPLTVDHKMSFPSLMLYRTYAYFDLVVNPDQSGNAQGFGQFRVTGAGLNGFANHAMLIPEENTIQGGLVAGPSYYSTYATASVTNTSSGPYSTSFTAADQSVYNAFGCPDTDGDKGTTPNTHLALFVAGRYTPPHTGIESTATTYHYIPLYEPGTQKSLSVLRNNRYTINITSIEGPGFASLGNAKDFSFVLPTANASLTIHDPLGGINYVTFNNKHWLGVSQVEYDLPKEASTGDIVIATNFHNTSTYTGWHVKQITDINGTAVSWVTLTPNKATNSSGNIVRSEVTITAGANTGAARTAYVWIQLYAGSSSTNLSHDVHRIIEIRQAGI